MDSDDFPLFHELVAGTMKVEGWLASFQAPDFDILPTQLRADASAKGLGDSFFGGKSCRHVDGRMAKF